MIEPSDAEQANWPDATRDYVHALELRLENCERIAERLTKREHTVDIAVGSYVLATKYDDGDPGDAWAVGYYIGPSKNHPERYLVGDKDGNLYYGPNGFRRIRANLNADVGRWLVENCKILESSPPGSINIWTMLTNNAFGDADERETGTGRFN